VPPSTPTVQDDALDWELKSIVRSSLDQQEAQGPVEQAEACPAAAASTQVKGMALPSWHTTLSLLPELNWSAGVAWQGAFSSLKGFLKYSPQTQATHCYFCTLSNTGA